MANKKISQLEFGFAEDIRSDDLITYVDVDETDINIMNKVTSVSDFAQYIKASSNLFPVPFTRAYIQPQAYINGVEKEISSSISGKTINISNIGKLYFDQYGRVYDVDLQAPNDITSVDILMGVGSAATYYKTPNATGAGGNDVQNTGYFNADSYYTDGTTYNVQKINYSNNPGNFINWSNLFEKSYVGFKNTSVDIVVGTSNVSGIWGNSEFHLFIDWEKNTVTGNGIIQLWDSKSYSMIWSSTQQTALNGGQVYKAALPTTSTSTENDRPVAAKVIINFASKQILGLPIWQGYKKDLNLYPNYALPLNVIIKSTN